MSCIDCLGTNKRCWEYIGLFPQQHISDSTGWHAFALTRSAQDNVHMVEVLGEKQSVDTIVPVEYDRRIARALLESSVDARTVIKPTTKGLHRAYRVPRKRGRSERNQSQSSPNSKHERSSRQFVTPERGRPSARGLPLYIPPGLQSRATRLRDAGAGRAGTGRRTPSDSSVVA